MKVTIYTEQTIYNKQEIEIDDRFCPVGEGIADYSLTEECLEAIEKQTDLPLVASNCNEANERIYCIEDSETGNEIYSE